MSYKTPRGPGRQKKVKNLIKLDDGSLKNQEGVIFTEAEKRALVSAVNQANRKRREMLKFEATLPRRENGRDTGDTVASRQRMGYESDFILQPKSKSLQRFKSKDQYNRYMENLHRVNSKDYIEDRIRLYKRNHMKAIEDQLGKEQSKDILMKIRMMKPKEYMKMVASEEDSLDITFVYDDKDAAERREKIRQALGMKSKEEYLPTPKE